MSQNNFNIMELNRGPPSGSLWTHNANDIDPMATNSIYVFQGGMINYVISYYHGGAIDQVVGKLIPLY